MRRDHCEYDAAKIIKAYGNRLLDKFISVLEHLAAISDPPESWHFCRSVEGGGQPQLSRVRRCFAILRGCSDCTNRASGVGVLLALSATTLLINHDETERKIGGTIQPSSDSQLMKPGV